MFINVNTKDFASPTMTTTRETDMLLPLAQEVVPEDEQFVDEVYREALEQAGFSNIRLTDQRDEKAWYNAVEGDRTYHIYMRNAGDMGIASYKLLGSPKFLSVP